MGLTHRRWLMFILWPVRLCQSWASSPGKKTTWCTSHIPGICEYSPPVLLQEALTDSGRKIWYHCFPGFWNSQPFQILGRDSTSLGTFENADLCKQRSRLKCNFYLCPQNVGNVFVIYHTLITYHSELIPVSRLFFFYQLKLKKHLFTSQQKETWLFGNCVWIIES